jgi:hypothetical protein
MTDPGEHDVLRELVDAEKALPDPAPEVGQRVFARLSASLALPAPLPDVASPAAPAVPPAAVASGVGRGVLGLTRRGLMTFVVGAAVGATAYGTIDHLQHRRAAEVVAPALVAPTPVVAPVPVPPAAEPAPPIAAPPPATVAPPVRASDRTAPLAGSRDRGLAAERKLIEMARTALARGQTDGALGTLHRHGRTFPKGQLAEERDSLLVQALVAKGDYAQARQKAARFRHDHPASLFLPVVDQAVRSIP